MSFVPYVHVTDVQRSLGFYRMLGFELHDDFTPPGEETAVWASLRQGHALLMIARASEPVVASQQAVLFYLYVDHVAAAHAELAAAGVAVGPIAYPFYRPGGEFRIHDPDGFVIMVTHT